MNKVTFIKTDNLNTDLDYKKALEEFVSLVNCDDLDARILANPRVADFFNEKMFDQKNRLFLQQRGLHKESSPGLWDSSHDDVEMGLWSGRV